MRTEIMVDLRVRNREDASFHALQGFERLPLTVPSQPSHRRPCALRLVVHQTAAQRPEAGRLPLRP